MAFEIDSNYWSPYLNRANTYIALGQYELAFADYAKVIEIDPNFKEAYINRGVEYAQMEQYELAIADFDKVIEIDPSNARTYIDRGNFYSELGRFHDSIIDYKKALSLNPYPYAYCVLGITYTKIGNFDSAIEELESGVALDIENEFPWCITALEMHV